MRKRYIWVTAFAALLALGDGVRAARTEVRVAPAWTGGTNAVPAAGLVMRGAATNAGERVELPTNAPAVTLRWYEELRPALLDAAMNYRQVFVLFTGPDCPWCMRLRNEVLSDPDVESLLGKFTLVDLDVEHNRMDAVRFGVRGVPTLVILTSEGVVRDAISGYAPKRVVMEMLAKALGVSIAARADRDIQEAVELLDSGKIPDDKWPSVMLAAGVPGGRALVRDRVLRIADENRKALVGLLQHPRLAVRLGALDLLEEASGETFGFEPWRDAGSDNDAALASWKAWAESKTNASAAAFTSLTKDAFDGYVQDLITDRGDPDRAVRARRMLIQGGRSTVGWLAAFTAEHPELPAGMRRRVQEVQYAILLPPIGGMEPALVAHRLVSGNLDMRLKTIRELPRIGRAALPILQELIEDRDPLVREAVVEAALKAGRDSAVSMLERLVAKEKDRDVLFVMIRELKRVTSSKGLTLLSTYLRNQDEDLAIAAFATLAKMESKRSVGDVRQGLRDPRWRVRVAALKCVQAIQVPELVANVESLLDDKDEFVRFNAVKTLAEVKGKQTVKKLEEVFLRDDNLKGPIIAAFGSMDMDLPASFGPALKGKPASLLLSVAGNLVGCGARGLPIASDLAEHPDNDVACAALSLLAARGGDVAAHRAALVKALESKDRERMLTVLRGLRQGSEDHRYYGSMPMDAMLAIDSGDGGVAGTADGAGVVGDMLDAFFGGATSSNAPPQKAPPPPAVTNRGPTVDDMFSAFMGPAEAGSATNVAGGTVSQKEFTDAIRARIKDEDAEVRFAAGCALLARGDMSVISEIAAGFADRPEDERRQLAYAVRHVASKDETLPFFMKMLGDASASVRSAAVSALLETKKADRIEALFKELLRPDARLKASEVYTYNLRSDVGSAASRKLREWVEKILGGGGQESRVTLGLALLQHVWKRGDTELVERYLLSEQPLVRRGAWYVLGKKEPKTFAERMAAPAHDSSDLVRMVVPAVFRTTGSRWVHYFTEEEFDEDWSWDGGWNDSRRRLDDAVMETLRKMENDVSPKVRFGAMLALLDQGENVPMDRVVKALDGLGDVDRAVGELQSALERGGRQIASEDAQILLVALERGESSDRSLSWLRRKVRVDDGGLSDEPLAFVARHGGPVAVATSGVVTVSAPAGAIPVRLIYFVKPGCPECAEVDRCLEALRGEFPLLRIEEHDIEKSAGKRYNEALCKRFDVPDVRRLVAPAIFATAGALVKEDVTYGRLGELIHRSSTMTDTGWAAVPAEELAEADTGIKERWKGMTLAVVIGNALSDGVNPCAFATIIFLLSYLQVVRRTPRQTLAIGMAFVVGVFVAYYGLGLGLAEIVKHSALVQRAGRWLNYGMAGVVGVLAVLNIRDGILCARGRMGEMLLQLPGGLKAAIHRVIRYQVRQAWMVVAAFAAGLVVSVLEMACTGQVYLPTIYYILKDDPAAVRANAYLLVYNVAFVVPLCVVFGLAYSGVRSERVALWLESHAATVKFATAALFVAMLVLILWKL